jgi:hypothetical protein
MTDPDDLEDDLDADDVVALAFSRLDDTEAAAEAATEGALETFEQISRLVEDQNESSGGATSPSRNDSSGSGRSRADVSRNDSSGSVRSPRRSRRRPAADADALRREIHRALNRAGVDAPTRPALAKLTHDQADLLVDLLEGFEDRRAVLEWQQQVVIQTLGQLEDYWFTRTATDAPTVSALLGAPWGPVESMDRDLAAEIRRGMVAKDLLPAFVEAHRVFRWSAVERVDHLDDQGDGEAPDPVDPAAQEHPLMRPAFGELHGQQQETLETILDGFSSVDRLLVWTVQVVGSSYAELDAETASAPYFERPLRRHLLEPTDARDRFVRRSWAAEYLLPAYNRAADQLAQRAAEVTAREQISGDSGAGSIS